MLPWVSSSERYVPAAGFDWLTGSYDLTVALSMRERAWRPALVQAVSRDLPAGGSAVEIGCGTGSLTIALAQARPDATVFGVDGDAKILALARAKAGAERVTWLEGLAGTFELPGGEADVALVSLVLHHLSDAAKAAALAHVAGVLRRGGALHVADWGPPRGPASALGARGLQCFDGREGSQSLLDGRLPAMLAEAGFAAARRHAALRTVWGTLEIWRAALGATSR
jgi:ubiquinone/menaquinone biosynthesis C-methylase UbiE